jgi:hypothetical protein
MERGVNNINDNNDDVIRAQCIRTLYTEYYFSCSIINIIIIIIVIIISIIIIIIIIIIINLILIIIIKCNRFQPVPHLHFEQNRDS